MRHHLYRCAGYTHQFFHLLNPHQEDLSLNGTFICFKHGLNDDNHIVIKKIFFL